MALSMVTVTLNLMDFYLMHTDMATVPLGRGHREGLLALAGDPREDGDAGTDAAVDLGQEELLFDARENVKGEGRTTMTMSNEQ